MPETCGDGLRDQWTLEAFHSWQLTKRFQFVPNLQILHHPALNPGEDTIWLGGLRMRLQF